MSGHEYITVRLLNRHIQGLGEDHPAVRALLSEAAAVIRGRDAAMAARWQTIDSAPLDRDVLLWWRPRSHPDYPHPADAASPLSNNRYAECCVIGQVSSHEPGTWWNSQTAKHQDLWHVTHWMELPTSPKTE